MRTLITSLLLAAFAVPAMAQKRDPLTAKEVDQMRDAAQDGEKRLKLMTKFAEARMMAIDQVRGDSKLAGQRPQQIHDLLEDFTNIVQEMDENLEMYFREQYDLRKGLKKEIEALTEFQLRLRGLKSASTPQDLSTYGFALDSATEEVNSDLDSARESLDKQNQQKEEEKEETRKKKH